MCEYTGLVCNADWHLVGMLVCHAYFREVEMSYEVTTVKNEEQDCSILILYSLRSSSVSNVFSLLISIYAFKRMTLTSRMALLSFLLCKERADLSE